MDGVNEGAVRSRGETIADPERSGATGRVDQLGIKILQKSENFAEILQILQNFEKYFKNFENSASSFCRS